MIDEKKPETGEVGCEAACRLCGAPRPDDINHIWACCGDGPGYGNAIKPEKLACVERRLAELRREHLRILRLRAGLSLRPASELLGWEPKRLGDLEHGRLRATDEEWAIIFGRLSDAANTGAA
jgi:hypothetical protein